MAIKLIVDSSCDLSPRDNIDGKLIVIPMDIIFNEEAISTEELTNEVFYERLRTEKVLPSTSQINESVYLEILDRETKNGDSAIVLTLASKMSGCFNNAVKAKQSLADRKIEVIDSKNASYAFKLLVEESLKLIESGLEFEEIVNNIEKLTDKLVLVAVIDDLTNLKKSGRINKFEFAFANLLTIKPIIQIRDGVIKPIAKALGLKKSFEKLGEMVSKFKIDLKLAKSFAYTYIKEDFENFKNAVKQKCGFETNKENQVGPVVGTHVGIRCYGVAFFEC